MSILSFLKTFFENLSSSEQEFSNSKLNSQKIGRNDLCHCGSGKKYKRCHLESDEETKAAREFDIKIAQINRSAEPNWGNGLTPEQSVAQQGLNRASELLGKKKQ